MDFCDKPSGFDKALDKRYKIAIDKIRLVKNEEIINREYRELFISLIEFIEKINETYILIRKNKIRELDLTELERINKEAYCNIMEDNYQDSYFNPTYVVEKLGEKVGNSIFVLSSELLYLIEYVYKGKLFEIIIILELFIKVYDCLKAENELSYKLVKQTIYDYYFKHSNIMAEGRIVELIDTEYKFYYDIIMNSDLNDLRYLYYYGKNITDNELRTAKFINGLTDEEVKSMAFEFTEGFRKGFISNNIDLSKKEVVNIRFFIGFERLVKQAILNFKELGLEPTFTVSTTSPNRQYYYDHRYDIALYFDEKIKEKKLESLKEMLEKYKDIAIKYAGPAVIEVFGEELFSPIDKDENLKLSKDQQKIFVDYNREASLINNIYIKRSESSFTIIAYPISDIGEEYEEIFRATVKVNTLDAELYQEIQQVLIDTLDQGDYVRVKGDGNNKTDIKVMLYPLVNSEKESKFENCVADVNIPVGEVFTSPVLKGTEGLLHLPRIYLKGLEYKELELYFKDGKIIDYSSRNFDNNESNKRYIKENLMNNHDTLPMGEFAIGTNTTAYVMGKKYNIQEKLPILIAEKTGPHFAIGDTCYSMSEDTKVFNPDGKEIVARDNEISILRKTVPEKAYLNCHTDITLPYDELEEISVYKKNGEKINIIKNGRFVLPGTEELNKALDEN
ncbi:MAG TPA: aminopeptidase [Clostridiales bacterium]|nr:aminopeptidase [Clostridiales bacterium]